jgi:hydroxybutyrate-dimer hydrolase
MANGLPLVAADDHPINDRRVAFSASLDYGGMQGGREMKPVRLLGIVAAFAAAQVFAAEAPPVVQGSVKYIVYDGISDDLLSGGLNLDGLKGAAPPVSANPTAAELRRRAIYNNYRGIVDAVEGGGIGLLWGPQSPGTPRFDGVAFGLIPGVEYKAYLRVSDRQGHVNNVPAAVQIPRNFDPANPCIVAALPSGSRSVYGGIAIAEWGLFKGCAIALPGKGTDTGFHLLGSAASDFAVNDLDGVYGRVEEIGNAAQFAVKPSRALDAYLASNPNRVATKHAHSQLNPERLWGDFALAGIEFALWALSDHYKKRFDKENTLVIAAAASNGGGMALRALEKDAKGLIDGVVVTEPNIGPQDGGVAIRFGNEAPFKPDGRSLYDSITLMSVYAACAMQSPALAGTPFFGAQPLGVSRCTSLKEKGLVSGDTTAEQAASALSVIRAHGYAAAQDWGIASHDVLNLWRSLQATYANAYGRFAVEENVCGVSFAATNAVNRPAPMAAANAKVLFADSSGVPPTPPPAAVGVNLIADRAANGPILENASLSISTGRADLNIDSALCFRFLETGDPSLVAGLPASFTERWAHHAKVDAGTRGIETDGRLHGRPAIIIHGREDALVFPNLHSRAYYALNQQNEGRKSRLTYIEVTPGQHFDAFITSFFQGPGGVQFAPLHFYFVKAMDSMHAHLTGEAPLPPSQVVRPTPRGKQAYTADNVRKLLPAPSLAPEPGDRITFDAGVLFIPQ